MAKFRITAAIAAGLCASIATIAPASGGAVTPVTEYSLPADHLVRPVAITLGPDNNMWYTTEFYPFTIGRITSWGQVTEFPVSRGFNNITAGPDGNLWYCSDGLSAAKVDAGDFSEHPMLVRLSTTGVETDFPIPSNCLVGGITQGPDGNLWYTATNYGVVGRVTLAGDVAEYPIGGYDIASGPDGNLWVANGDVVYQVNTAGQILNTYPTGTGAVTLTAGPNGTIWFCGLDQIGRITIATGQLALFPARTPELTEGITAGADGGIWYTWDNHFEGPSGIARMTADGVITDRILLPAGFSEPIDIAVGPVPANSTNAGVRGQKALWFTESQVNRIGVVKAKSPK